MVLDRAQLSKMRIIERTRFKLSNATTRHFAVCPQTGTRVVVDSQPDIADIDVDVDDTQ
jgi:hypothetical protein